MSEELFEIKELLKDLQNKLDLHISQHDGQAPKVEELIVLLERFKGVFILFKFIVYAVAPITAILVWIKDHVRF